MHPIERIKMYFFFLQSLGQENKYKLFSKHFMAIWKLCEPDASHKIDSLSDLPITCITLNFSFSAKEMMAAIFYGGEPILETRDASSHPPVGILHHLSSQVFEAN